MTASIELFDELKARVADVQSSGVADGAIKYGLDRKLPGRSSMSPPRLDEAVCHAPSVFRPASTSLS